MVGVDPDPVRLREDVLTPRGEELTSAVKDDDRGTGIADNDEEAILGIDGHTCDHAQLVVFPPAFKDLVSVRVIPSCLRLVALNVVERDAGRTTD